MAKVLVNGRGVRRRKMTTEAGIALATDVALGLTQITPSIGEASAAVGVSPYSVRQELKACAEAQAAAEQQAALVREGTKDIVEAWHAASDWGQAEALRIIGVAEVWDVLARVVG